MTEKTNHASLNPKDFAKYCGNLPFEVANFCLYGAFDELKDQLQTSKFPEPSVPELSVPVKKPMRGLLSSIHSVHIDRGMTDTDAKLQLGLIGVTELVADNRIQRLANAFEVMEDIAPRLGGDGHNGLSILNWKHFQPENLDSDSFNMPVWNDKICKILFYMGRLLGMDAGSVLQIAMTTALATIENRELIAGNIRDFHDGELSWFSLWGASREGAVNGVKDKLVQLRDKSVALDDDNVKTFSAVLNQALPVGVVWGKSDFESILGQKWAGRANQEKFRRSAVLNVELGYWVKVGRKYSKVCDNAPKYPTNTDQNVG